MVEYSNIHDLNYILENIDVFNIGRLPGRDNNHTSEKDRYLFLIPLIEQLYLIRDSTLSIRDSAVGKGNAILELSKQLIGKNIKYYLNGKYHPTETIEKFIFNQLPDSVVFENFDLLDKHDKPQVDISIISFLQQYLTPEEFSSAILNELEYANLVCVSPFNNDGLRTGTRNGIIFIRQEGELSSFVINQDTNIEEIMFNLL